MKLVFENPTTNHREVFSNSMTLQAADFGMLNRLNGASDPEPPFYLMLYFRDSNGQFTEVTGMEHLSETGLNASTDRRRIGLSSSSSLIQASVAVKYMNEEKDRPNDNFRDQSLMS